MNHTAVRLLLLALAVALFGAAVTTLPLWVLVYLVVPALLIVALVVAIRRGL
jgi:uncharacterized protein (DUF983 family)